MSNYIALSATVTFDISDGTPVITHSEIYTTKGKELSLTIAQLTEIKSVLESHIDDLINAAANSDDGKVTFKNT